VNIKLVAINVGLPGLATVWSDEMTGVQRDMMPQLVWPKWAQMMAAWFLVAGIATSGYLLASCSCLQRRYGY
jgi:hypothetical protein